MFPEQDMTISNLKVKDYSDQQCGLNPQVHRIKSLAQIMQTPLAAKSFLI